MWRGSCAVEPPPTAGKRSGAGAALVVHGRGRRGQRSRGTVSDGSYFVTGAAGFLGGTIVWQLVWEGKKVRDYVLVGDPA